MGYSGYSNTKWLFLKQTKSPRELTRGLESSKINRAAAWCLYTGPAQAPVEEEQRGMGEPEESQGDSGSEGPWEAQPPGRGQARALRAVSSLVQQPRRGDCTAEWVPGPAWLCLALRAVIMGRMAGVPLRTRPQKYLACQHPGACCCPVPHAGLSYSHWQAHLLGFSC